MSEPIQIIGLGELLWDCFPDRRLPGGAPANVAYHAQQLGLKAAVATRIGNDDFGDELCNFLVSQGLSTELVQRDFVRSTGTVTISPDQTSGTHYHFLENSAWDYIEADPQLLDAVRQSQAICFGTLAQRRPTTRTTVQRCLRTAPRECVVVFDVNLRPPFYAKDWIVSSFERANIVKLNSDEVQVLSEMLAFSSSEEIRFAKGLLDLYRQVELVCVTRGSQGCLAVTCDEIIELPGIPCDVVDTVGAGDAFTAATVFGKLQGWSLSKTIDLANRYGSKVASRPGAMPTLTSELDTLKSEIEWAYRETPLS